MELGNVIFDGWAPVMRSLILGVLAYVALVLILRVSGKRTLSKMNAFDFVVTVALGSTLAAVLTSAQVSLTQGVAALALLVALQYVNTFVAVRWPWYQRLLKAQPTLVFFKGQPLDDALRKQRLTRDEVLEAIRQQGISRPEEVDAVILETEGSLSVVKSGAGTAEALERQGVSVDDGTHLASFASGNGIDAGTGNAGKCPLCGGAVESSSP